MKEPEFDKWDLHPLLPLLRFVDVESSGLHEGSYPIQFGWCGLDLKTSQVLVRPEPEWTSHLFSPKSYEIHGISRDRLLDEGMEALDVASLLNRELGGKAAISDSPSWDGGWTKMLFDIVDVRPEFGYNDFSLVKRTFGQIFDRRCVAKFHPIMDVVDHHYPHSHKADEDALRMGAMTRAMIDHEWAEWLLARECVPSLSDHTATPVLPDGARDSGQE